MVHGEEEEEPAKVHHPLHKRKEQTHEWVETSIVPGDEDYEAAAASPLRQEETTWKHHGFLPQPQVPDYDESKFDGPILQPRTYQLPKNGLSPWHPINNPDNNRGNNSSNDDDNFF